ncbi:hypothetical protein TOTORO_02640 [Serratia phage vB_SmaS-Totoro]|nr:hypothetical protein TOTORO_02640 [Serratia phage vB_SmaS-Totoro]
MANSNYYNKPTNRLVFDLIKEANPDADFSEDQVRLTNFTQNTNGDPLRNTAGILKAIAGMGREGQEELTWNRPALNEIFKEISVYVSPNGKFKKSDLLKEINSNYNFQLDAGDIYDGVLNLSTLPTKTMIIVRPTCPAFTGQLEVTIGDPKVALETVIRNHDLDGLQYPTNQSEKIQGPLYLYANDYTFDVEGLQKFGYGDPIEGELLDSLNRKSPDTWVLKPTPAPWNANGADVWFNGPTASAPVYVNTAYQRCLVIHLDSDYCSNVAGHLILHYNMP